MYSEEKDNKIIYVSILVIAILLSLLVYFILFNKCKNECKECEVIEPDYQLINYSGFIFKMPLNWNFVNKSDDYSIVDSEEKIFINMKTIKESYEAFIEDEYQNVFLEDLQTSDDIKIDKYKKENNYYTYEGNYNNYKYLIIAIGNNDKVVLTETKFIDKITYNKQKKNVVTFVLSSIIKSED